MGDCRVGHPGRPVAADERSSRRPRRRRRRPVGYVGHVGHIGQIGCRHGRREERRAADTGPEAGCRLQHRSCSLCSLTHSRVMDRWMYVASRSRDLKTDSRRWREREGRTLIVRNERGSRCLAQSVRPSPEVSGRDIGRDLGPTRFRPVARPHCPRAHQFDCPYLSVELTGTYPTARPAGNESARGTCADSFPRIPSKARRHATVCEYQMLAMA